MDDTTLFATIREKLFALPGSTPVVCGHGPDTTIDEEKRLNPFAGMSILPESASVILAFVNQSVYAPGCVRRR